MTERICTASNAHTHTTRKINDDGGNLRKTQVLSLSTCHGMLFHCGCICWSSRIFPLRRLLRLRWCWCRHRLEFFVGRLRDLVQEKLQTPPPTSFRIGEKRHQHQNETSNPKMENFVESFLLSVFRSVKSKEMLGIFVFIINIFNKIGFSSCIIIIIE